MTNVFSNEVDIFVPNYGLGQIEQHHYIRPKGSKGPVINLDQRNENQVVIDFSLFEPTATHSVYRSDPVEDNPITEGTLVGGNINPSVLFEDNTVDSQSGYKYKVISNNTDNLVKLSPSAGWSDVIAAVNSVDPIEGKVIIVPAGLYMVTERMNIVNNNTHLIFDVDAELRLSGNGSIFRNYLNGETYNTLGSGGSYCSITGGRWTLGDQAGQSMMYGGVCFGIGWTFKNIYMGEVSTHHHLEFNGSQDIKIINCEFDGLYSDEGPYSDSVGKEMIQIEPSNNAGGPTKIDMNVASKNILIEECTFRNPVENPLIPTAAIGDHDGNSGVYTDNVLIRHCHFEDISVGVHPYEFINTVVEYCTFHNVDIPVSDIGTNNISRHNKITYN